MLQGFKQFMMRGNVVDLAIGVVMGSAFGAVVDTMVKGIITPIIGAIFKTPDFSGLSFTINSSQFMYGTFLNAVISFVIIATTIYFFVITPLNKLMSQINKNKPEPESNTKVCSECQSEIPKLAKKCKYCASII